MQSLEKDNMLWSLIRIETGTSRLGVCGIVFKCFGIVRRFLLPIDPLVRQLRATDDEQDVLGIRGVLVIGKISGWRPVAAVQIDRYY